MFGEMPAYGFFIRHVKGLEMDNVDVSYMKDDVRPAFVLNDVKGADFHRLRAERGVNAPIFLLRDVENFSVQHSQPLPDTRLERMKMGKL
jgi:hypothetical protein